MEPQISPVQSPITPRNTTNFQLLRLSGSGAFALAIIMFFFTFCFVKCNETKLIRFTGIDLAFALEGKPYKEMNSLGKMGQKSKDMFDISEETPSSDNAFDQAVKASSRRSDSKGLKQQGYKVYNAMALIALLMSAGALVVSILPAHKYGAIAFVMGLVVVVALLLTQVLFNMELQRSGNTGGGMGMNVSVKTEYTFFYWFSILLAIAGAVTGLIRYLQNKKNPHEPPVAAF